MLPAPASNLYFGSTPPEAYFRPDRKRREPPRTAAVKDGRHVEGEACSALAGRSLRAASTAAHCGGSGLKVLHALPLTTPIAARLDCTGGGAVRGAR